MTSSYLTQLPSKFGEALRVLRKRARLTQDEMGRAVGYSREQIARLESGARLPDPAVVVALFVPALFERHEDVLIQEFLALAHQTRNTTRLTVTHALRGHSDVHTESVPDVRHHLPAPLLPLIGRAAELATLPAVLADSRLLTLVGAPGIGKSRLALELAHRVLPAFAHGAALITLADIDRADDVPLAVVRGLNLTLHPGASPVDAVATYLRTRRLLLVLDNCEHVLDGTTLFADWLTQAPGLKLLCTSRVPLDLYGEQEWPVAPLQTPDMTEPPSLATWSAGPAMQLLLARVRAAVPGFVLDDTNLVALATLCVALDGLPLALELAAARLRDLPAEEMVAQLLALRDSGDRSSSWLEQSKRNVAARHRTLQAAIDWSVHHLPASLAGKFLQLGVFAGGCTPDAAQAVAGADIDELWALARGHLVDFDGTRVHMLQTLRAYAVEHGVAQGELQSTRARHAAYFRNFALELFHGLLGTEQGLWMQRGLTDHDNCLAALRWALAQDDGELALSLASSLWWFWYRRGLFGLAETVLTDALRLTTSQPADRARALNGLASVHLAHDDYAASLACHREGLALRRQLQDAIGIATALHNMGLTAYRMGDYAQAIAWLEESVAADPSADPAQAWTHIGIIALNTRDLPAAHAWLQRAWELAGPQGGWIAAFVQHHLADTLFDMGELNRAHELAVASLNGFESLGDSYYCSDSQLLLARVALCRGDVTEAQALVAAAMAEYATRGDAVSTAEAHLVQAELAEASGHWEQAELLRARAWAERHTVPRPLTPREQMRYPAPA